MPDYQIDSLPVKPSTVETTTLRSQAVAMLLSKSPDEQPKKQAPSPGIDRSLAAEKLHDFVEKNFSLIDDNGDKFLSPLEVRAFAWNPKLNVEDKAMANFLLANYEDLNKLTDAHLSIFSRLNPKSKAELTLKDLAMLRTCTSDSAWKDAIKNGQSRYDDTDKTLAALMGGLVGITAGAFLVAALVRRPESAIVPLCLFLGAGGGSLAGYRAAAYAREKYYLPRCKTYYEQKKELSEQILGRIK